jgi:hypothetical protein
MNMSQILLCPSCNQAQCAADAAYRATKDAKHARMAECMSASARYWMARAIVAEAALKKEAVRTWKY